MTTNERHPTAPQLATEYTTAPLVAEFLPAYEAHLVGRGQRPRGVETYMMNMRQFLTWLGPQATIADVTELAISLYRDDRAAVSVAATVALDLTVIRSFCKFLMRRRLLSEDPTQWVDFPSIQRRPPRALSRPQLKALWAALATPEHEGRSARWHRERNRRAIFLMLFAGLRISEACALLWGDVDLEIGQLLVRDGKNGKFRTLPLHPTLWAELRKVQNPDPAHAVMSTPDGTPLTSRGADYIFRRWLPDRGLRITAHQLRHTFASEMLRNGAPLVDIQSALGHESLDTTSIYLLVDGEHLRSAIELLPAGW